MAKIVRKPQFNHHSAYRSYRSYRPYPAYRPRAGATLYPHAGFSYLCTNPNPQHIAYVQPRHISAANAFCKIPTHMRVDTISQSSLLEGIRSRNIEPLQVETGRLVSPLTNEYGHSCFPTSEQRMQYMVAERVAYLVNASQELEVNKKDIRDKVINEISCSADYGILNYAGNHPEKVADDVDRALATSEALRPNQNAARQYNLQAKINAAVT